MESSWTPLCFLMLATFILASSNAQLVPTETRILFQIQQLLEYPQALETWSNWTNFCFLPPTPSLTLVCSDNHITELTIVGNRTSPSHLPNKPPAASHTLSPKFSTDSFFTVLTKLSNLQKLSLVSLGMWGPLPAKINRFRSLQLLNLTSNFLSGQLPTSLSTYSNLTTLVLSDNLFNETIPDLTTLSSLQELDLRNNHFGPTFPSLPTNLAFINLANNSLRSEIPRDLKKLSKLRFLDASSNKLLGPIPSFLLSLPLIERVALARNQLSGAFPPNATCGGNLKFVDVSSNLLIGKLPSCLAPNAGNKTVVIMWNCLSNTTSKYQRPNAYCRKDALAVMPNVRRKEEEESTLKLGIVLGVIGGIVAILGVLGLLILLVYRRLQRKGVNEFRSDSFVMEKGSSPMGRHVPQPMRMTSIGLPPYHVFTLEDMEDATSNFDASNLVGEGGSQGQLYKGRLRDGSMVLVKCLKLKQKHSPQALQHHMEVISKLRHRHLVSVLGHCIVSYHDHPSTATTVFIVLENMSNASLRDHLINWRKREALKWPQRMAITMGVARGIQYLHTGGIVGNDIKIDTILLDESLTARISSYNIIIPSKVGAESPLHGSEASSSPSTQNPEKEDIYRLGAILVEVITGRPVDSQSELQDLKFQLERSLAESPSKLRDLIDPSMRGTFAYESLKTVVQITINCLSKEAMGRPTVEDVLWHMQYSVQVQEGWTNSGSLSGSLSGNLTNRM